ncbi:hypothetical protein RRG08_040058 [Elysia crispata]|uniref:Uncharacterized protein n=1 Tax=Elysia crispata TaxID=231223 RepID=A0AAE0XW43_9GAST|nr:hypothetical protein RRG08_040058 [Elysia crispata]
MSEIFLFENDVILRVSRRREKTRARPSSGDGGESLCCRTLPETHGGRRKHHGGWADTALVAASRAADRRQQAGTRPGKSPSQLVKT